MAIPYIIVPRSSPRDPQAPNKYYAMAKSAYTVTLPDIAEELGQQSSLTRGDVYSSNVQTAHAMARHLSEGAIVQLGDMGSFRLFLQSDGVATPEEFTYHHIRGTVIRYTPSTHMLNSLKYAGYRRFK